jgi:hypothetical protein
MDRVRGRERVDASLEQLRAEHLLHELEPSLLLYVANEAERHSLARAELLERDPEELRRRVDDHDPEAALGQLLEQP